MIKSKPIPMYLGTKHPKIDNIPALEIDPFLIADDDLMSRLFNGFDVDAKGCWMWRGHRSRVYAQISWRGVMFPVHRLMWVVQHGIDVPPGLEIDHLCRVTRCCNPAHLEAVPHRLNTARGTGPTARNAKATHCPKGHPLVAENIHTRHGRRGYRTCLTCPRERAREQARLIRQAHTALGLTRSAYVREYGQSVATARKVISQNP